MAFLQQLQAPLGHRGTPPAWLRPVRYECWAVRKPHKGLPFADVLTVLLHHRLGMGVRTAFCRLCCMLFRPHDVLPIAYVLTVLHDCHYGVTAHNFLIVPEPNLH